MKMRLAVIALLVMSLIGFTFGVWLFRSGFVLMGCAYMAIWLASSQRVALWLIIPNATVLQAKPTILASTAQRFLLAILTLIAAAVSAVGVYIWYISPVDWQAGLVFILFGLIVLIPVTISEVRLRRNLRHSVAKA